MSSVNEECPRNTQSEECVRGRGRYRDGHESEKKRQTLPNSSSRENSRSGSSSSMRSQSSSSTVSWKSGSCSSVDSTSDECTDDKSSKISGSEMRDENDNNKECYKTKRKDNDKRKDRKNGAALGRRLSQWLRDLEDKKEEEQKESEKKEEETTKDSDTNSLGTDVVEWKSEVEIEYVERTVVL